MSFTRQLICSAAYCVAAGKPKKNPVVYKIHMGNPAVVFNKYMNVAVIALGIVVILRLEVGDDRSQLKVASAYRRNCRKDG